MKNCPTTAGQHTNLRRNPVVFYGKGVQCSPMTIIAVASLTLTNLDISVVHVGVEHHQAERQHPRRVRAGKYIRVLLVVPHGKALYYPANTTIGSKGCGRLQNSRDICMKRRFFSKNYAASMVALAHQASSLETNKT